MPTHEMTDEVRLGSKRVPQDHAPKDAFSKPPADFGLTPSIFSTSGLRKAYTGKDGTGSKSRHEDTLSTVYDFLDVARPLYDQDLLIEMYKDYTNYAAIQAKVANVVGLGFDFVESDKTLEKEDAIEDDSDAIKDFRRKLRRAKRIMFDRLDDLNHEEEFIETIEKVAVDYEVTGNGYLEIGRTSTGEIGYIGHIPAQTMRIRRRRDGYIQFIAGKPVYFRRYGDSLTPNPLRNDPNPNEIIHFKKYTPADSYYGAPDIVAALSAVVGNKFADEYNLDYFENKAVPRNLIILRGGSLGSEGQRKLLSFFDEDLRGSHHRSLFIPLPATTREETHDLEIKGVENSPQDSAFREYARGNIDKILMVHRVPSSKLGMGGEGSALAAAKDFDKTFKEQVTRPLQRVIEKKVNRVIKEMTNIFHFKLNELDLIDENTRANIDTAYHALGARTANEIRARLGLPGLEGGDRTIWEIMEKQAEQQANSQGRSETAATATNARARDTRRATGRTDSIGEARNPKGEGRRHE